MSSDSQILANQTNSQLSTGPKTPEGKRESSRNSVTHGFAGRTVAIPAEAALAYQNHCLAYLEEFVPVGVNETALVQQLADLRFGLNQMLAVERQLLTLAQTLDDAALAALPKLSVYYHRKHRAAESTLKQLSEIQTARKAAVAAQLREASAIHNLQESRHEPFDPASIGFACSIPEIKTYIRYRRLSDAACRAPYLN